MSTSDPLNESPHGHLNTGHQSMVKKHHETHHPHSSHHHHHQSSHQQHPQHEHSVINQETTMIVQDDDDFKQQNKNHDEQREINKRFLVSLAMILPAVAAIIGQFFLSLSISVSLFIPIL